MNNLKVSRKIGNIHGFKISPYKILITRGLGRYTLQRKSLADTTLINNNQSKLHQSWGKSKWCTT